MPRILVVNDDGIHGPGLRPLIAALRPLGKLTIVVPDQERSTVSHALTLHRPIRVREVSPGFYMANGLPTDCARFGILELLKEKLDLVVSGINHGLNIGDDVLYSGTVAAAMEGTLLDVPAIAASQDVPNDGFEPAAKFTAKLARKVLREGLPSGTLLNVNFPAKRPWKGLEVTTLCKRLYGRKVHPHTDPRGSLYYWLAGDTISAIGLPGSDAAAIERGKVAVTPLRVDMTDEKFMPALKRWKLTA